MSENSAIEWTDATWNPIAGCSVVSPACKNCYAMAMAARIEAMSIAHAANHGGDPGPLFYYSGLTQETRTGPVWTGKIAIAPEPKFLEPLRWKKPRRIFVNSMSDLFHENVADETIDRVFATMALCPQHTFQILTRRPARMRKFVSRLVGLAQAAKFGGTVIADEFPHVTTSLAHPQGLRDWPLPNVWLGVTAERQQETDERIPELLATPSAEWFVSIEPQLGEVDLTRIRLPSGDVLNSLTGETHDPNTGCIVAEGSALGWAICGGESGPNARPMDPDWPRVLRDQCAAAAVPFFFKQWGEFIAGEEIKDAGGFRVEFGDGSAFRVLSDGEDILLNCARDHKGAPEKIWKNYFASGDGRLLRRASKHLRLLDGHEHSAFPAPLTEAAERVTQS
jgi:protein gp37